ncbi:MAG: RDD family protein [Chloroflexi bacterium]|nr:RDD family protein [Chloroflexota bacterium]
MAGIDTNETSGDLFCGNCGTAVLAGDADCSQCGTQVRPGSDLIDLISDYVPYCRACGVPVAKEAALHCTKCWVSPLCREHFYPSTRSCSLCPPSETTENDDPPSLARLPNGPWARPLTALSCPQCGARINRGVEFCPNCGTNQEIINDSDYAGLFPRVGAAIIDALPPLVVTGMIFPFFDIPGVFLLLLVGYHALFTYKMGRTLGKKILGIQVIATNGQRPTLKQILLREVVGKLLIFFTLFIGFLWIIWEPKRRGWHDYFGGTYVTHEKRD